METPEDVILKIEKRAEGLRTWAKCRNLAPDAYTWQVVSAFESLAAELRQDLEAYRPCWCRTHGTSLCPRHAEEYGFPEVKYP